MRNIGRTERFLRLVIALILFIVGYNYATGYYSYVAFLFGVIFVITGLIGWCPLFSLFGYSSKGKGIDKITKRDIERAVKENSINFEAKSAVQKSKKKVPAKKKPAAKKATVTTTKTVAKKAPVKKKSAKKPEAKKSVAKKAPAKKTAPKKTATMKVPAKKAASKKASTSTKKKTTSKAKAKK